MNNMTSHAETDVLGRHGVVGKDILPHDLDPRLPIEIGQEYVELVENIDLKVKALIAKEMAEDAERYKTESVATRRSGQLAVADSASIAA